MQCTDWSLFMVPNQKQWLPKNVSLFANGTLDIPLLVFVIDTVPLHSPLVGLGSPQHALLEPFIPVTPAQYQGRLLYDGWQLCRDAMETGKKHSILRNINITYIPSPYFLSFLWIWVYFKRNIIHGNCLSSNGRPGFRVWCDQFSPKYSQHMSHSVHMTGHCGVPFMCSNHDLPAFAIVMMCAIVCKNWPVLKNWTVSRPSCTNVNHYEVMTWKCFLHYWRFVRGIYSSRSGFTSKKGQ